MTVYVSPSPKQVLRKFANSVQFVDFDVTNPEHMVAYVCLTQFGRQHPTLRFNLSDDFIDVRSMMNAKVGATYAAQFPGVIEKAQELTDRKTMQ